MMPVPTSGDSIQARPATDYVLRTTQQNMVQLSALADQKASIVLGASFVVATIVFSGAADDPLGTAKLVLAITAIVAGVLAAVSLFPTVGGRWRPGARTEGQAGSAWNPLFFGSIARVEAEEYQARMRAILADDERVYGVILADLHQAANVLLHRKYRWLQASYLALITGMLTTLGVAAMS